MSELYIKKHVLSTIRLPGAKSTIITMSYPIWTILGEQQKRFVLILCQTRVQAKQHMVNLKRELESNTLLKNDLGAFPEGVLIEMLLWVRQKDLPIKVFSIPKTMVSLGYSSAQRYEGKPIVVKEADLKNALSDRYFHEISAYLDKVTPILRPVTFIDIRNEDFKYVDWVRAKAYEVGKVPIVPQHLIPEFVYALHDMQGEYDASVEALREKYPRASGPSTTHMKNSRGSGKNTKKADSW